LSGRDAAANEDLSLFEGTRAPDPCTSSERAPDRTPRSEWVVLLLRRVVHCQGAQKEMLARRSKSAPARQLFLQLDYLRRMQYLRRRISRTIFPHFGRLIARFPSAPLERDDPPDKVPKLVFRQCGNYYSTFDVLSTKLANCTSLSCCILCRCVCPIGIGRLRKLV